MISCVLEVSTLVYAVFLAIFCVCDLTQSAFIWCLLLLLNICRAGHRVSTGQGKLEKVGILCGQGKVGENIILEKSGKTILDHADCRYL